MRKRTKDTWLIAAGTSKKVTVTYRNYAQVLDAGESYLDASEAYINPITVLMYVPGSEFTPSLLRFDKPDDWNVATALDYDAGRDGYPASDYHELVDSPFIISPDFDVLTFEHEGATYELVFQGEGNYDPDKVINDVRAITKAQTDIMKVTPFDRYVILYHLLPQPFGHGVEHKNSTSIVVGPADFTNDSFYYRLLGITSHEIFHIWNVERIRPEAIYHPDYSKENYTTTMWVYEGITSYYTALTIARAGLRTPEQYINSLGFTLQGYDRSFGRKVTSVAMTSWNSWVSSNAPPNTTYSFYTAGNVLGLLLDLEIRGRTENRLSLDDVFRYLYTEYAAMDKPVPEYGFEAALETVVGTSFQSFFDAYVYGTEEIDYNQYLRHAGLNLEKMVDDSAASLGVDISTADGRFKIRRVNPGSPAEKAGLTIDDVFLSIDGKEATESNFRRLMDKYAPGDTVELTYLRKGKEGSARVKLGSALPNYRIARVENPTALQTAIYRSWLAIN